MIANRNFDSPAMSHTGKYKCSTKITVQPSSVCNPNFKRTKTDHWNMMFINMTRRSEHLERTGIEPTVQSNTKVHEYFHHSIFILATKGIKCDVHSVWLTNIMNINWNIMDIYAGLPADIAHRGDTRPAGVQTMCPPAIDSWYQYLCLLPTRSEEIQYHNFDHSYS